jgi:hypothetical protein
MTAQLATEALGCHQVIAKVNDPLRPRLRGPGLATLCRTNLMASAVSDFLGLGLTFDRASGTDRAAPRGDTTSARPPGMRGAVDAAGGPRVRRLDGASSNGSIPTPLASTTAREG